MFKNFLTKRQCVENLTFWMEVQLLKNTRETPESMVRETVANIIKKYVEDDSLNKLNLDSEMTNLIIESTPSRNMFDNVVEFVLRLLETTILIQFKTYILGKKTKLNTEFLMISIESEAKQEPTTKKSCSLGHNSGKNQLLAVPANQIGRSVSLQESMVDDNLLDRVYASMVGGSS